jgi:CBS domain-containing protein
MLDVARDGRQAAARDVMGPTPVTVTQDTPLLEVLHLMVVAEIGGVAVIGDGGAVVGVIAASDVLRVVDQVFDGEIDDGPDGDQGESLTPFRARDVMTPEPVWVGPDTPTTEVARLMRERGIHRVLVGVGGRLDGIVTTFDLIALLRS